VAIRTSGIPQADLARTIGVNRSTICRFLAGRMTLSQPTIDSLAEVLKLKLANANRRQSS